MFVVQLPHVPSLTVCLFFVSLLLHFYFLLFPSISIDVGATKCNSLILWFNAVIRVITVDTPNLDWRGFIVY